MDARTGLDIAVRCRRGAARVVQVAIGRIRLGFGDIESASRSHLNG